MNQKHEMKQIAPNIFKITRFYQTAQARESLFVKEPAASFEPSAEYACHCDAQGRYHFLINQKEVLCECDSVYTQGFAIGETDGIYGLGIHQKKALNRRNTVCQMIQVNGMTTAVPFFVSTGGYAVLFDTCAFMSIGIDKPCTTERQDTYDTDETTPNEIHVFADDADTFTYYVILGESIAEQIAGYRVLTGKAPMYPKWAYGFFQSREHYKTQEEVLAIAHEFRNRQIPLDCIVQDWNYWGDLGWNAVEWDTKKYPDPKAMIDEIHKMDAKLMISVWPSFGPQTNICKALEQADGILEKSNREEENWGRVHDPLNPKASDIVWDYMNRNLFSLGVDAWWLDSTEPSFQIDSSLALLDCSDCYLGKNSRYLNHYAMATSRNIYKHQRGETDEKRVYILTRSGYAGQQAYGASTWTGDIRASWEVFRRQISSLLSFSLSGIPYSTTDIGAFFVSNPSFMEQAYEGGNENEAYRELYTRWFWFGAFSPLFRSHGTDTPREMWFFGEPGSEYYESQLAVSRLRYALMPYIYASAFDVYKNDSTLMRPLVMEFGADERVKDISDTYLFGSSLLVHIVTEPNRRTAEVYLPSGADWFDFYTGKRYEGGQAVTVDAPIAHIPVFVKCGSIIPMAEPAQCTAQQDETRLKLYVYSGADATATYYQDENDSYRYENGDYMQIPMSWNDAEHRLTIESPCGKPALFDSNKTIKLYLNNEYQKTVSYCGEQLEILL